MLTMLQQHLVLPTPPATMRRETDAPNRYASAACAKQARSMPPPPPSAPVPSRRTACPFPHFRYRVLCVGCLLQTDPQEQGSLRKHRDARRRPSRFIECARRRDRDSGSDSESERRPTPRTVIVTVPIALFFPTLIATELIYAAGKTRISVPFFDWETGKPRNLSKAHTTAASCIAPIALSTFAVISAEDMRHVASQRRDLSLSLSPPLLSIALGLARLLSPCACAVVTKSAIPTFLNPQL